MNIFGFPEFPYPGVIEMSLTLSLVMTPAIEAAALTWLAARIYRYFHRPLTRPAKWTVFAIITILMALTLFASFPAYSPSYGNMFPLLRWLMIIPVLVYFMITYALAYGPVLIGFHLFHEIFFGGDGVTAVFITVTAVVMAVVVIVVRRRRLRRSN